MDACTRCSRKQERAAELRGVSRARSLATTQRIEWDGMVTPYPTKKHVSRLTMGQLEAFARREVVVSGGCCCCLLLLLLLLRNFTLGENRIESRFNKTKTTGAENVELPT